MKVLRISLLVIFVVACGFVGVLTRFGQFDPDPKKKALGSALLGVYLGDDGNRLEETILDQYQPIHHQPMQKQVDFFLWITSRYSGFDGGHRYIICGLIAHDCKQAFLKRTDEYVSSLGSWCLSPLDRLGLYFLEGNIRSFPDDEIYCIILLRMTIGQNPLKTEKPSEQTS